MPQIQPNVGKFTKPKKPEDVTGIRTRNIFENYGLGDMDTSMSQKPTFDYKPPPTRATIDPRPPVTGDDPTPSMQSLLSQLGDFDDTDRDAFRQVIQSMPTRAQNKPDITRRIVASGLGLGAKNDRQKTMDDVLDKPYTDKLSDWKARVEPSYQAAQLENTANANERALKGNILTNETAMRRNEQQYQIAEKRNEISKMVADAKAAKWDVKIDGPRIIAISPDGQTTKVIGASSDLSQADEINLKGAWNVAAQQQRVNSIAANQQAAGAQFITTPTGEVQIANPRDPNAPLPPKGSSRIGTASTATTKPNSLEARRALQDKLNTKWQTDPTTKRWLMMDSTTGFPKFRTRPVVGEIDRNTTNIIGRGGTAYTQDDVDEYDAIRAENDPTYKPPAPRIATGATKGVAPATVPSNGRGAPPPSGPPTTGRGAAPAASKPRLRVMDPKTGKTGTIGNNEAEINDAMSKGYRVEAGGR